MKKTSPIRVLITDDMQIMREAMVRLLETVDDIEVAGEAALLEDALLEIEILTPDVIVMNDYLPPMSTTRAARLVREKGITTPILIASRHPEAGVLRAALNAGANGFLIKEELFQEFVPAIRAVHNGDTYFSPEARRILAEEE